MMRIVTVWPRLWHPSVAWDTALLRDWSFYHISARSLPSFHNALRYSKTELVCLLPLKRCYWHVTFAKCLSCSRLYIEQCEWTSSSDYHAILENSMLVSWSPLVAAAGLRQWGHKRPPIPHLTSSLLPEPLTHIAFTWHSWVRSHLLCVFFLVYCICIRIMHGGGFL